LFIWQYPSRGPLEGASLEIETFLGPEMHSWAMQDKSVTSDTGTLMPECRCRLRQLTTGRNADAGQTFIRHSGIYI
jgi:hypothetical protein